MENKKSFKTPKNVLARMQVVHLGKILFNLEFVALALMFASVLSFLVAGLYYLLLMAMILLSLGTLLASPGISSYFSGGETLTAISYILAQSWKYTVPILLVFAAASIVCLCFDKQQKHIVRIVFSAIFGVLAIVVLILKLVNGGV